MLRYDSYSMTDGMTHLFQDGWEPLCKFLNKTVPDESIPHDNRTGDEEFIKKYGYEHKARIRNNITRGIANRNWSY